MQTSGKVIKYLLFIFNFLFFVGGVIIFGLSVYTLKNKEDYQITDELLPALNLLICVGAITLFFGFLGCCGAIKDSRCLLALFFKGLLLMFLMLIALGVLGAVARTASAQELMRKHLKDLLPLSEQPQNVQVSFQNVEKTSFCCGLFVGHQDWGNSSVVPNSCNCTDISKNCTTLEGREVYAMPCIPHIMTWLDRVSVSFIGIAFALGVLMILGMTFSMVMICQLGGAKSII